VQAVAGLPELVRPGVFLALVFIVVWFILVQRAMVPIWRFTVRGLARLIDGIVGVVLRLEFTITTARRRHGRPAARWALVLGEATDAILDRAASLHERHEHTAITWRRPPWKPCVVIVLLCTGAWLTMEHLSANSIAKYRLAQAFGPWRDLEAWADAGSGRGTSPRVLGTHRRRGMMSVRVRCRGQDRCRGWIVLRARSGAVVSSRYLEMPRGTTVVRLRLSRDQARMSRGGRVVVDLV
jgi:hypothetical protein